MPDPKFAPIPSWGTISGMSRTATYEALVRGDLTAIKVGRRTLIVVEPGLAWLHSLPKAMFQTPAIAKTSVGRRALVDAPSPDE